MIRYVAADEKKGLFIGHAMGLAFFSFEESAGQWCVWTFESPRAGVDMLVLDWKLPNRFKYFPVDVAEGQAYAQIADLKAAGLSDWLGDLERNFLIAAPAQGPVQ